MHYSETSITGQPGEKEKCSLNFGVPIGNRWMNYKLGLSVYSFLLFSFFFYLQRKHKIKTRISTTLFTRAMSIRWHTQAKRRIIFGGKFESNMETVAIANIFMGTVESQILHRSVVKPLVWKRYIDHIFSIWNYTNKDEITQFMEQAKSHYPTIKFTVELSDKDTTFLYTSVYKGERFANEFI